MSDISGAIADVQMDKIKNLLRARRETADFYREVIDGIDNIQYQHAPSNYGHANYIFSIDTRDHKIKPQKAVEEFRKENILARPIYGKLSYQQESISALKEWRWANFVSYPDYSKVKCPIAESIAQNHFEIPIVPSLTDNEKESIKETIKSIFG